MHQDGQNANPDLYGHRKTASIEPWFTHDCFYRAALVVWYGSDWSWIGKITYCGFEDQGQHFKACADGVVRL